MAEVEFTEQLAEVDYENWRLWVTLFLDEFQKEPDGSMNIPATYVKELYKHVHTLYSELSERGKQECRNRIFHMMPIITEAIKQREMLADQFLKQYGERIERLEQQLLEQQKDKPSESSNAMELIDWRLRGIKETIQVLEKQLDGLLRQPEPGRDMQFWMHKAFKNK